jgi:glycosidase
MATSVDALVASILEDARSPRTIRVDVDGDPVELSTPFPSPEDWRDLWIYFLMVDRFDNPAAAPRTPPWDGAHGGFQGGTLAGVRSRLGYLHQLGVGAVWLSPVLKNCQYDPGVYHGYGIQDFVALEPRFSSDPTRARHDPGFVDGELRSLVDEAHARGMYVILDIVLNHTGDVFEYEGIGSMAPFRDQIYPIRWRDADGTGRADWAEPPAAPPRDAAVWPAELRDNRFFRRQGNAFGRPGELGEQAGDFFSLKELVTDAAVDGTFPVRDVLIRAYQYLLAKFDVDGFRIDTLKYIEPDFARIFGNAMREFALSIGKKNFFTFGEVYDNEDKIARFIGRSAGEAGDLVGVDAALDFPLFYRLPQVAKALPATTPADVAAMFEYRKQVQRGVISSHGEASRFFVTFLDNHDQNQRLNFADPTNPHRFDDQVTLALACLFCLQGIPCLYYGTEQGLAGAGTHPEAVREALWGKPDAFDTDHPFARACQELSALRRMQPALRYGRQYFRPISGDGTHFAVSAYPAGVIAFSRILNDVEILVAANTHTTATWSGDVIVDRELNPLDTKYSVLFANKPSPLFPEPVADKPAGTVVVHEPDGSFGSGPLHVVRVNLEPMQLQVLGRGA